MKSFVRRILFISFLELVFLVGSLFATEKSFAHDHCSYDDCNPIEQTVDFIEDHKVPVAIMTLGYLAFSRRKKRN